MTSTTTATPTTVTVRLPQWLVFNERLCSRELTGTALKRSRKGVLFSGHAVVRRSDYCLRCGRSIDNLVSKKVGYGPDCSAYLGIPRDVTEAELEEMREQIRVHTHLERWLPLHHLELVDGEWPALDEAPAGPATLTVEGDRLLARTPFSERNKAALKAVRGARWDGKAKAWTYPATETSAVEVVGALKGVGIEATLDDAAQALAGAGAVVFDQAADHKATDDELLEPIEYRDDDHPHWPHQLRAFHFAADLPAAMLAIGMGGGKSRVVVDVVCQRQRRRVLILCPKNVVGVWPKQFRRHATCDVDVLPLRKGTVSKRAGQLADAYDRAERTGGTVVVAVNYEAAWRSKLADEILSRQWDLVVLDESHKVKAPGGKASMFCAKLRKVAGQRLCLTGTPMPHSPLDVYAQYRFLDPGVFGTSFAAFRARYAVMGGYGGHEVLGFQRQEELADRMYRIAYRIADEELDAALGLEEPTHQQVDVELGAEARRVYKSLSDDLFAEVDAGTVSAANALVKLLRLQQVTSGLLPVESDETGETSVTVIDTGKREALADLLDDVPTTEPVVVFCRFTPDLDNVREVCERQGRRYAELSGRRRDGLTEDSTMSPDCDVIGVQIQSGGVGIDLTRSHYCVFYSVGFSLGDYDQALKRTHRPGQEHRVSYYHLVAEGTVDERVYDALRRRKSVVEHVLGLG